MKWEISSKFWKKIQIKFKKLEKVEVETNSKQIRNKLKNWTKLKKENNKKIEGIRKKDNLKKKVAMTLQTVM